MANEYDVQNLTNLGQLKKLAQRTKTEIGKAAADATNAIKSATYSDNTLKLFRTTDTTGTAAFTFDLPEEMFLDQAKTEFVGSFAWSAAKYPGSTNPNLDGKPVMVLAVKGDGTKVAYSFLDMQALVDTYTANDDSVTVGSYKIGVKIDDTAGNALTLVAGKGLRVDISGKADKVEEATSGDFPMLDGEGNLADSGVNMLNVQQKITGATEGNVRTSDANGFAQDGGVALSSLVQGSVATDTEVDNMINDVFGAEIDELDEQEEITDTPTDGN